MAPPTPLPVAPPRRTVARSFAHLGIGVHSGERAAAEVQPAPFGTGLVFRDRSGAEVPATIGSVVGSGGSTVLGSGNVRIGMVEHVLAALYGMGVTDAIVAVSGPEVPMLDGSAKPWVDGILQAGLVEGPKAGVLVVRESMRIEAHGGSALVSPSHRCEVSVEVDFGDPGLPHGRAWTVLEGTRFAEDVAWARTFVLERDVERLVGMGRGQGASTENTVVWGATGPTSPLRAPDEAVRHKLLDLVGDLALIGSPFRGSVEVAYGSHALHHEVVAEIASRADRWRG